MGCPAYPNDCRGTEALPIICVLVTLPPSMETKGIELKKGFQLKGLLNGTKVASLMGGGTIGLDPVVIGADPEGLEEILTVVMTVGLGLGIS